MKLPVGEHPCVQFLSTPSAWRATLKLYLSRQGQRDFYPRPPHGGRRRAPARRRSSGPISTHALRMEGDIRRAAGLAEQPISTHALRMEGDISSEYNEPLTANFYPRPPHGGRQSKIAHFGSFHLFLPTPSAWRATYQLLGPLVHLTISTHALRMEGDCFACCTVRNARNFYPRPPHGGRQNIASIITSTYIFLPTPSAWRATASRHF